MVIILDMQIKPFRCLVDSRQARIVMACISVHFWKGACADERFFEIAITYLHELPLLFKNKLQWLKYGTLRYFFDEFSALQSKYLPKL